MYRDPTGHEAQPMGLDLSKVFSALKEKVGNSINNISSSVNKTIEGVKQTVSDKLQQAKNSITERLSSLRSSTPTRNNQQGQALLQTDQALNQNDREMANRGCYFRAAQHVAEQLVGRNLSADQINAARSSLQAGRNPAVDRDMTVNNPDPVINDAFRRLGRPDLTATVGWGNQPSQRPAASIISGPTTFPSGASGTHFRTGDANRNQTWDPAPGGNTSTNRMDNVFVHRRRD